MSKKLWIIISVLILLITVIIFISTRGKTVKVETYTVQRGSMASYVSTPGVVTTKVADLGINTVGRIVKISAKEGQHVSAGQVLAVLDSYAQAKRDYESTKSLFNQGFASLQQFENSKTMLENRKITSPISGVVAKVNIDEGEIAQPGIPVITVVDVSNLWVEIQIDETDISNAKVGQEAKIYSEAYENHVINGKVSWINYKTELKKTGGVARPDEEDMVFRAKVSIPKNILVNMRPGMSVDVDLLVKEKKNTLIVPRSAIVQNKNREMVAFIITKERRRILRANETKVEVGIKDPSNIEILSGLKEGDLIAVSNLKDLENGVKVQIEKEK